MSTRLCVSCGMPLKDGNKFCNECGVSVPVQYEQTDLHPVQPQIIATAPTTMASAIPTSVKEPQHTCTDKPIKGSCYESISTRGYMGIFFLMCIPIMGQILTIVWACGGCRKINKRNLARAMLIFLLISFVIGASTYFFGQIFWESVLYKMRLNDVFPKAVEILEY
ncbi:zinc-ribbon domain-containing protein [Anaerovorax odorimutans]|uniref:zinc-ribbon domain-containing protein n=1 Tax=Anaerovorax odorimutans TaxID=109327 RepID=UPI0004116886|nr:zinc ribbon domain-containing protein [Anaerovorax odorimutans]